ncbi:MAG: glycine cleavage system aminomethyltransferase GcvT, partial [Chloroflexota bacterium]
TKTYFVGQARLEAFESEVEQERWEWQEPENAELRRTPLYHVHKQMGANMVPFAGWEMPVWYSSVKEEHQAVREAAGLFDVGHMGVFEVTGANAIPFLDVVFSNYAAWIDDGESMYGYFLEPDGAVIDDGIIYRVAADHFYMVVNASNEEKDWDWLNAVNDGRVLIDEGRPWVEAGARAMLRNLKRSEAGADQRRDLALQGPASLDIAQRLTHDPELKIRLARMRRTELMECELAGVPLLVARTGYTGEECGYEILVHPDDAETLWKAILREGEDLGVRACGLACRDSTRIEAGLPLYGHELAGPFEIDPVEAGFPGYVKYHKPFFVGRRALLEKEGERVRELVRFRVTEKGTRRPDLGDPVVDRRGREIGKVTSCSIDTQGYLVGLAIVERRYNTPDTPIAIFPLRGKSLDEALLRGNRVQLPIEATIITRFPEAEGAGPPWMGVED